MSNYSQLQADLKSYTERQNDDEFATYLPLIISLGEKRITNELKFLFNRQVLNFSLTTGLYMYQKPSRWRRTVSMRYATQNSSGVYNYTNVLYPRSYEYCLMFAPDSSVQKAPAYYADADKDNWLIVSTPDQAYPAQVVLYADPEPLSDINTENVYTQKCYDLLLYASLLETAPYLQKPEWIERWEQSYSRILAAYNSEADKQELDQSIDRGSR